MPPKDKKFKRDQNYERKLYPEEIKQDENMVAEGYSKRMSTQQLSGKPPSSRTMDSKIKDQYPPTGYSKGSRSARGIDSHKVANYPRINLDHYGSASNQSTADKQRSSHQKPPMFSNDMRSERQSSKTAL